MDHPADDINAETGLTYEQMDRIIARFTKGRKPVVLHSTPKDDEHRSPPEGSRIMLTDSSTGKPPLDTRLTPGQVARLKYLVENRNYTRDILAYIFNVNRSTIYRELTGRKVLNKRARLRSALKDPE